MLGYPYLWRAVKYFDEFFKDPYNYDKIVYMDNDFYVLTSKLANYIKELNSEYTSFWCPKYNFRESACQILMNNVSKYKQFIDVPNFIEKYNGSLMERVLPITNVVKHFIGDRYNEYEIYSIPKDADFCANTLDETIFVYDKTI